VASLPRTIITRKLLGCRRLTLDPITSLNYRRYHVFRKQPMSFTASNHRILTFENDYMHIVPGDTGKTGNMRWAPFLASFLLFLEIVGSAVSTIKGAFGDDLGGYYRRYHVFRKQPMSFTASNHRILTFENDYTLLGFLFALLGDCRVGGIHH
jgi:hypothetical protein